MRIHNQLAYAFVIFATTLPITFSARASDVTIRGANQGPGFKLQIRGTRGQALRRKIADTVGTALGRPLASNEKVVLNLKAVEMATSQTRAAGPVHLVTPTESKNKNGKQVSRVTRLGKISIVDRSTDDTTVELTSKEQVKEGEQRLKEQLAAWMPTTHVQTLPTLHIRGFHRNQIQAIKDMITPELSPINSQADITNATTEKHPDGRRTLHIDVQAYNKTIAYSATAAPGKPFDLKQATVTSHEQEDGPFAFGLPSF